MSSPSPSPSPSQRTQFTSPTGVTMTTYTTYEAHHPVHPDHIGFVVGRGGNTIKGVAKRFKVDARTRNSRNGGWPNIVIRGNMQAVEGAFLEIRKIANIANQKIPRVNNTQSTRPPPIQMPTQSPAQESKFEPKSPDYTPSSPAYIPTEPAPPESGDSSN